jgi:hypothetical protein
MAKAVLALVGEEHILVDPSSPTPMDGVLAYQEMVEEFRSTFPNFKIKASFQATLTPVPCVKHPSRITNCRDDGRRAAGS